MILLGWAPSVYMQEFIFFKNMTTWTLLHLGTLLLSLLSAVPVLPLMRWHYYPSRKCQKVTFALWIANWSWVGMSLGAEKHSWH